MAHSNTEMTRDQKIEKVRPILARIEELQSDSDTLLLLLAGDRQLKKHFTEDHILKNLEDQSDSLLASIRMYRLELRTEDKSSLKITDGKS